ncbi:40S ribosomal protein S10 [Hibiscus syriacus]|uniref:40S ribosomal protein S10 n=1 Tax=Hibiscus syriacus TaxID=106335 RepID=A0A6A3CM78_HIBSY|nr:40S ribosomal protein S10 [Hibiscus syriacus]
MVVLRSSADRVQIHNFQVQLEFRGSLQCKEGLQCCKAARDRCAQFAEIVPATLKKSTKLPGRPGGQPGDRPRGPPRFEGDCPRFGDRYGYRGGSPWGDFGGDKEDLGNGSIQGILDDVLDIRSSEVFSTNLELSLFREATNSILVSCQISLAFDADTSGCLHFFVFVVQGHGGRPAFGREGGGGGYSVVPSGSGFA